MVVFTQLDRISLVYCTKTINKMCNLLKHAKSNLYFKVRTVEYCVYTKYLFFARMDQIVSVYHNLFCCYFLYGLSRVGTGSSTCLKGLIVCCCCTYYVHILRCKHALRWIRMTQFIPRTLSTYSTVCPVPGTVGVRDSA